MTTFTHELLERMADFGATVKGRLRGGQEGAISAEYVAILLVVAGIVAVVVGLGLTDRATECGNQAAEGIFGGAPPAGTC